MKKEASPAHFEIKPSYVQEVEFSPEEHRDTDKERCLNGLPQVCTAACYLISHGPAQSRFNLPFVKYSSQGKKI